MFFFEQLIQRQIHDSNGLYPRYMDDLLLVINWLQRHLSKQVERWNEIDVNIDLAAHVDLSTNFLDLHIENRDGQRVTNVNHKPSHERTIYRFQVFTQCIWKRIFHSQWVYVQFYIVQPSNYLSINGNLFEWPYFSTNIRINSWNHNSLEFWKNSVLMMN